MNIPPSPTPLRRAREPVKAGLPAPDSVLPSLVSSLLADPGKEQSTCLALHQLCTLTAWQEQNQRRALELEAVPAILRLLILHTPSYWYASGDASVQAGGKRAMAAVEGTATDSEEAKTTVVVTCLSILCNLCANDDLSLQVARVPTCAEKLVSLLNAALAPEQITVNAARCLISLTQHNNCAQEEALKAGLLDNAVKLLINDGQHLAFAKLGCWLLANVTTPVGSAARVQLLQQPHTLNRLVQLVKPGQPEPIVILACNVLSSLVRKALPCSPEAQAALNSSALRPHDTLTEAGALKALAAHAQLPGCGSKVLAAVLNALACLVLGHRRNAAALAIQPGLASALGLALEQHADAWTADYDSASTVLAAHTLLHVLAHMLCNTSNTSSTPPKDTKSMQQVGAPWGSGQAQPGAGQVLSLEGQDTSSLADGSMHVVVSDEASYVHAPESATPAAANSNSSSQTQGASSMGKMAIVNKEAIYISLAAAAKTVGVVLPHAQSCAAKDGSPNLLPIQAAEIRNRVTNVLLPRLRSPNHRTASTAAAVLYHWAAGCGGGATREARRLMADSSLIKELLQKLSSQDPPLMQACLAVLDVLSTEPACGPIMLSSGWLAAVVPLLESEDGLVRRWADRALCSLYLAGGKHLQQ